MESVIRHDRWEQQYQVGRGLRWWPCEELVRFIGSAFVDIPRRQRGSLNILDVGCGTGNNARFLLEEGFSVTGLDASPKAVQIASGQLSAHQVLLNTQVQEVQVFRHSILDPFPAELAGPFDGVVDVQTIQHTTLDDHFDIYERLYRAMSPGAFLFSVHMHEAHWDAEHGGGRWLDRNTKDNIDAPEALFPHNGVTCFVSGAQMKSLLGQTGFVVESIEHLVRTYRQRTKEARYLITVARKE